ncbi:MAG: hypothetical protein EBS01_07740, partial [Verrucomicrobia bacterium]|nr:hypothetical protein [Verrucomicrobiota bacterium]
MNQDSFADPTTPGTAVGGPLPEAGTDSPPSSTLTLELGDFLHRIPPGALKEGPHPAHQLLTFERSYLEERLRESDPTLPLSELFLRVPGIFRSPESAHSDVPVRMPYLKVTKLLAQRKLAARSETAGGAFVEEPPSAAPAASHGEPAAGFHSAGATALVQPPAEHGDASDAPDASFHGAAEAHPEAAPQAALQHSAETQAEHTADYPKPEESVVEPAFAAEKPAGESGKLGAEASFSASGESAGEGTAEATEILRERLAALERQRAEDAAELAREREARRKAEELLAAEVDRRGEGEAEDEESYEPQFGWELRAVKQLESDIETYRGRIRLLLTERDALQEKNAQLQHQLHSSDQPAVPVTAPNAGPAPANPVELQNRIAQLKQERAVLEKARQEALHQLEEVRAGRDQAVSADSEVLGEEVLALRESLEKARREIEQLKADKELLLEVKKNDIEGVERVVSGINERTVQGLRRSIDAQSKAVSSLTRERDALAEERDSLSSELKAARSQHQTEADSLKKRLVAAETSASQLGAIKSSDDARIQELTQERDALRSAEDSFRREVASLQERVTQAQLELQETAARFDAELRRSDAELSSVRAASESAVEAARLESQEKLAEMDKLRLGAVEGKAASEARAADIERARNIAEVRCKDLETDVENLRNENRELNLRLGDALKERDDTIARLREEHRLAVESATVVNQERLERAESLHQQAMAAAKESHDLALDQMARENATQVSALKSEMDTAKADLLHELEQLKVHAESRAGDHQRAVESLRTTHAATLELTKAQHQQALDSLRVVHEEEISALRKSKDDEIDDIEAASKEALMRLEAERNQLLVERNRQLADIRAAHEEQLALFKAEHERALAAALGERAMAVAERDQRITSLSSDRDRRIAEWTTRYEALQAEHTRVVATIGAERDAAILVKDQQIAEAQA